MAGVHCLVIQSLCYPGYAVTEGLRVAVLETATGDHSGRGQRESKSAAITGTSAGDHPGRGHR